MKLALTVLEGTYAICRLPGGSGVPSWVQLGKTEDFVTVTCTTEEVSVVCADRQVPDDVLCSRSWRCLKVEGPLDLSQTGILSSLTDPLAEREINLFAISTYDTDYLLVPEALLERAVRALSERGFQFQKRSQPDSGHSAEDQDLRE